MTEDLFTDQFETEETLRDQLTNKWKEKTPEEILKAKVDADLYIKTLERQKDELRSDYMKAQEEIQKGKTLDDLLEKLNKAPEPAPLKPEEKTPTQMGLNEIEKLFENKFEAKKLAEVESKNFAEVQSRLRDRFGQNSGQIVSEQASTLGLSKEEVNALAKKSPEAFFRMMGLNNDRQDLFMAPPRSDVRNDSFAPKTQKRTWNYYQEMKAKNPTAYWSPRNQLQMHRDAEALGNAFEDGDFNS